MTENLAYIEAVRERLLSGVRTFRAEVFPHKQETYERVMREGQSPHTLFVTCADSRVEPALLTQTEPGEIFVCRNIGNLIPAYGEMIGGISAVVEYAVMALDVKLIVICGHTDCGAINGLLKPDRLEHMPTVKSWLRNAEAALSVAHALAQGESLSPKALVEQNVLLQVQHLRTHPSVAGRLAQKKIDVTGWVYDIEHGTVSVHNEASGMFEAA